MYVRNHICLSFTITSDFSIILDRWRAHLRKKYLCDIHTRTEDNRYRVHIRELECDIEIVSRIDETCSIMDDKPKSCEWWLSRKLDEILLRSEFFYTRTQYRDPRTEDKSCLSSYYDFFITREDFIDWIYIRDGIIFYDKEFWPKTYIIAGWLEAHRIEIRDTNITRFEGYLDVTIREIHITIKRKY